MIWRCLPCMYIRWRTWKYNRHWDHRPLSNPDRHHAEDDIPSFDCRCNHFCTDRICRIPSSI